MYQNMLQTLHLTFSSAVSKQSKHGKKIVRVLVSHRQLLGFYNISIFNFVAFSLAGKLRAFPFSLFLVFSWYQELDPTHFTVSLVPTWWIFTLPSDFLPHLEYFTPNSKSFRNTIIIANTKSYKF